MLLISNLANLVSGLRNVDAADYLVRLPGPTNPANITIRAKDDVLRNISPDLFTCGMQTSIDELPAQDSHGTGHAAVAVYGYATFKSSGTAERPLSSCSEVAQVSAGPDLRFKSIR